MTKTAAKCRCGKRKIKGKVFCKLCYFSLSRTMRFDLDSGSEEAYSEATKLLDLKEGLKQ